MVQHCSRIHCARHDQTVESTCTCLVHDTFDARPAPPLAVVCATLAGFVGREDGVGDDGRLGVGGGEVGGEQLEPGEGFEMRMKWVGYGDVVGGCGVGVIGKEGEEGDVWLRSGVDEGQGV